MQLKENLVARCAHLAIFIMKYFCRTYAPVGLQSYGMVVQAKGTALKALNMP